MSTKYDGTEPGGNSSFGNSKRPPDIQADDAALPPAASSTKQPGTEKKPPERSTVHGSIGSGDVHRGS